jgi:hypothetical protein
MLSESQRHRVAIKRKPSPRDGRRILPGRPVRPRQRCGPLPHSGPFQRIRAWWIPADVQGRNRGAGSLVCPFLPHSTRTGNVIPIPRPAGARPILGQTRLSAPRLPARTGFTVFASAVAAAIVLRSPASRDSRNAQSAQRVSALTPSAPQREVLSCDTATPRLRPG